MEDDVKITRDAELDMFSQNAKSSVKITNTTRGITWEIKVVTGEEGLIDILTEAALTAHKKLNTQLNIINGGK